MRCREVMGKAERGTEKRAQGELLTEASAYSVRRWWRWCAGCGLFSSYLLFSGNAASWSKVVAKRVVSWSGDGKG